MGRTHLVSTDSRPRAGITPAARRGPPRRAPALVAAIVWVCPLPAMALSSPGPPAPPTQESFEARLAEVDARTSGWSLSAADSLLEALARNDAPDSLSGIVRDLSIELRRIRLSRLRGESDAAAAESLLVRARAATRLPAATKAAIVIEVARRRAARAGQRLLEEELARLDARDDDVALPRAAVRHELGNLLLNLRERSAARVHLAWADSIRTARLGAGHPESARTRLLLAVLRFQEGDTLGVDADYEGAVETLRSTLGADHPDALWALTLQSSYWQALGRWERARAGYRAVLSGRRARGLPADASEAWTLNNLGVLCQRLESFAQAESLFREAADLRGRLLGRDPLTGRSLANHGNLLFLRGEYAEARRRFETALAIFEESGLREDPDRARCLLLLGLTHLWTEDLEAADLYLRRSLERGEAAARPEDQVSALQALGQLALARGQAAAGEDFFRRALQRAGADGPVPLARLAELQLDLGRALAAQERWAEAEREFSLALEGLRETDDPGGIRLGFAHYELGEACLRQGRFAEAATELGRSLHCLESALDPSHPQLVLCWLGLALTARERGRPGAARVMALQAHRRQLELVTRNLSGLTERHALLLGRPLDEATSLLLDLAGDSAGVAADLRLETWGAVAAGRNLVLHEMARRRRLAPGAPVETGRLARARDRLANLYLRSPVEAGGARFESLLREAVAEREAAERALAEATAPSPGRHPDDSSLARVFAALPREAVLVAFARTTESRLAVGSARPARYVAFVGRRGGTVDLRPLGPAGDIDRAVAAWADAAGDVRNGLRVDPARAEREYLEAGNLLRSLAWDPLRSAIGAAKEVWIVPAGTLALVSFTALPLDEGRFLQDEGRTLVYLNHEEDVESFASGSGTGLLALGAVDSDATLGASPAAESLRRGAAECGAVRSRDFPPLPGTRDEVLEAAARWRRGARTPEDVELLLGPEASESEFRSRAGRHRVLHLATHGFFLDDDCPGRPAGSGAPGFGPLVRSGLLLAPGAGPDSTDPARDGLLTAEEIASLDLSAVDVAVLSACRSGVGTASASEGLFGLRRAFQVAGARSLVVSLWAVGDQAAREWIRGFYDAFLLEGLPPGAASDAAARRLLDLRRREGRSTHPFYWASFITVGAMPGSDSGAAGRLRQAGGKRSP